ncbi:MAG: ribbon-helix-helix domain-containing protein [Campylobacterota bacterium]|nr:ribbon-helix-helix domain-containing protein [Campylobacterota bacterium]
MYALEQLEKQQVGLRLPKYLIDEIDLITKEYSLNRSEIITESIKNFISEQKSKKLYESFEQSSKEMKKILKNDDDSHLGTLREFIDELND